MSRSWLLLALAALLAAADPVAQPQAVVGTEDTAVTVVLAGSDADGDPLTYQITSLPPAGTLFDGGAAISMLPYTVADPGHAVRYVPAADDNGPGRGSFSFRVHDGMTWSPSAAVTVDLTPVNDPPVMTLATAWTVPEGVMLEIPVTGIGPGGGADEAGQTLGMQVVSFHTPGWSDYVVYYTPGATTARLLFERDFDAGVEQLVLSVVDNGGTANGGSDVFSLLVTITITPVNDVPYLQTRTVVAAIGGTTPIVSQLGILDLDFPPASTLSLTLTAIPSAGNLELDGVAMAVGDTLTMADKEGGRLAYHHTGTAAGIDYVSFTYTDGVIDTPRYGELWIVIGGRNPPEIQIWGITDPLWTEGDPPLAFAERCSVVDSDSASLGGGSLNATIIDGLGSDDVLSIAHTGFGIGQIGVEGTTISYGGVTIGTASGGTGGQPLRIALTGAAATPEAVSALAHALRFRVEGRNPGTATRMIQLVADDGDVGASPGGTFPVHVVPVDDPPVLMTTWIGIAAGLARTLTLTVDDPDSPAPTISLVAGATQATVSVIDADAHVLRIEPASGAVGSDSFTVALNDGVNPPVSAVVALTITGADDARPLAAGEFPGEVVADSLLSVDIPFDCRQIGDPASLEFVLAGEAPIGLALTPLPEPRPTVRATWSVPATEPIGHRSFQILAIDPVSRSVGVLPVQLPVRPRPTGGG
jgi:hypothetical protein